MDEVVNLYGYNKEFVCAAFEMLSMSDEGLFQIMEVSGELLKRDEDYYYRLDFLPEGNKEVQVQLDEKFDEDISEKIISNEVLSRAFLIHVYDGNYYSVLFALGSDESELEEAKMDTINQFSYDLYGIKAKEDLDRIIELSAEIFFGGVDDEDTDGVPLDPFVYDEDGNVIEGLNPYEILSQMIEKGEDINVEFTENDPKKHKLLEKLNKKNKKKTSKSSKKKNRK